MPQRNMMSYEELSTIIHFAPMCLVVLDRNRNLRRVNKMAESLLGLDPRFCTGQSILNWVPDTSHSVVTRVLNLAAEVAWSQAPNSANSASSPPAQTTISLHTRRSEHDDPGRPFWAEISCGSYFEDPKAPLHEASYILTIVPYNNHRAKTMDKLRESSTSIEDSLAKSPASSIASTSSHPLTAEHIATNDINLTPLTSTKKVATATTVAETSDASKQPESSTVAQSTADASECASSEVSTVDPRAAENLLKSVVHGFDFAIIGMTKDGRTIIRNDAMDKTLLDICPVPEERPWGEKGATSAEMLSDKAVDVSWLFSFFRLYDTSFTYEMPESAYPLYRAAILGERFKHTRFGCLVSDSGRRILESEGWPLYADEGKGEFIGGMIILKDVTKVQGGELSSLEDVADLPIASALSISGDEPAYAYYRNLCQELPDIAWIARGDGYLEWYNSRWYEYTGHTPEESVGAGWTALVHEDDFPAVSKAWSNALRTSSRYEVQERIRGTDGQYRWMLCRAHPFCNADGNVIKWFGYLTDIHQTLETLAANRESREHLTEAVRVADITLWSIDTQGIFTLAEGNLSGIDPNTSNSSLTGSQASDDGRGEKDRDHHIRLLPPTQAPIVGKSIYTEWGETTRRAIQRALAGETVVEETTIKGRTYRTHYKTRRARMSSPTSFLFSERLNPEDAPIVGVTGMSMDITERLDLEKKMAEGIREVARAEAAEAAATEASRMKSQFLAVISHEIRTPLNGVVGLSELLLDIESLPLEASDLVNSILRSAGALLTVINDVLDFSKVEAGRLDLVSLPFSLRLTCEDSVRDFKRLMAQKGLTLVKDIQLPDEMVMGDAGRITQVLNNLMGNAGKFTEEGSVSLRARKTAESPLGSHYTFTVSDTGCGVPASKIGLLFQPFRQADPSTSRRYGGSGLGLAICKNLIELMGGQISLRSEEGKGTTVSFTIPFKPAEKPLRTPTEEAVGGFKLTEVMLSPKQQREPQGQQSQQQAMRPSLSAASGSSATDWIAGAERRISTTAMSGGPDYQGLCLRRSSIVDVAAGVGPNSSVLPSKAAKPNFSSPFAIEAQQPEASGTPSTSPQPPLSPQQQPQQARPRVLLAEDNPINSQIAIKTLNKLGYDVDHVENGELVLLALESSLASTPSGVGHYYDLVLMDCMMPTMDGYQATRKMRASQHLERMRKIPVIALTAAAIQGQRTCFAAGMTDYLSKPVRRATLGAMLVKWLGREHPQNALGLPCMLEDREEALGGGGAVKPGLGDGVPAIEFGEGGVVVAGSSNAALTSAMGFGGAGQEGSTTTTTTTRRGSGGATTTVVTTSRVVM